MFEAWCKSSARSGLTIWLDELKSMKLARRLWVCCRDRVCVCVCPPLEDHCHIAWAVIGMFQWLTIPAVIMDLMREMPIVWLYLFWILPLFVSLTELTCRGNCWIALVLVLSQNTNWLPICPFEDATYKFQPTCHHLKTCISWLFTHRTRLSSVYTPITYLLIFYIFLQLVAVFPFSSAYHVGKMWF